MDNQPDLEELDNLWPESAKAKRSLETWCDAEGVPGHTGIQLGHRRREGHHEQPGFGLVNKPVIAISAEWRGSAGQGPSKPRG